MLLTFFSDFPSICTPRYTFLCTRQQEVVEFESTRLNTPPSVFTTLRGPRVQLIATPSLSTRRGVARSPQSVVMSDKLSQFVGEVVNFSSQYGTQGSNSYTASNLAGDLRVYDRYGDFVEAFVLVRLGRCPLALFSLCVPPWISLSPSLTITLRSPL